MQKHSSNKTSNKSTFAFCFASEFMSPHITLLSLILLFSFTGVKELRSQGPVNWEFNIKNKSETEVEFVATANMQTGWVIYSQNTDEGGPIPTHFTLEGKNVMFEEKTIPDSVFDEMFDMKVLKFKNKAVFAIRLPVSDSKRVRGTVAFMTCDGTRCLPPKEIQFDETY